VKHEEKQQTGKGRPVRCARAAFREGLTTSVRLTSPEREVLYGTDTGDPVPESLSSPDFLLPNTVKPQTGAFLARGNNFV
jgi:hypothetical protein